MQDKTTDSDLSSACDLCICFWVESWPGWHGPSVDGTLSEIYQPRSSLGRHSLAVSHWIHPAPGRRKDFPNHFSTDRSKWVKLFQVCCAGGYYDHREMVTLGQVHRPENWWIALSLLSPCNPSTAGLPIPQWGAADKHLGLVGWAQKHTYFFLIFPFKYLPKDKRQKVTIIR